MELTTVILNINKGYNEELMKTCQTLSQYTELVSRIRNHQKDMALESAVISAIDECISDGVLADFLSKNRREAIRVSVLECKVEDVMELLQKEAKEDGFAEGRTEGLAEGLTKGRTEGLAEGLTQGRTEGLTKGRTEGKLEAQLSSIQAITKSLNLTPSQAMEALNIPKEEQSHLLELLNN